MKSKLLGIAVSPYVMAGADGVWINLYAYLSDDKLAAIGEVCR